MLHTCVFGEVEVGAPYRRERGCIGRRARPPSDLLSVASHPPHGAVGSPRRGGEDRRRTQRGTVLQCERSGGSSTHTYTHTQTRTHARTQTQRHHFRRKLGQWRDLQPRRSDAGRHGRVFAEGPGQTGGESRALSRAGGCFLRVFVSENRDGETDDAEPQAAFLLLGGGGGGGDQTTTANKQTKPLQSVPPPQPPNPLPPLQKHL